MMTGAESSSYGISKGTGKAPFATGRQTLNLWALLWLLLLPCMGFFLLNALMSFSARMTSPALLIFIHFGFMCIILYFLYMAWQASPKEGGLMGFFGMLCPCLPCCRTPGARADGSFFYVLIFWSLILALVFAVLSGEANFRSNTGKYYAYKKFNTYMSVNASRVKGEQLMDAGRVMFLPETRLDLNKSMAFKTKDTYCVAPIVQDDVTGQTNYDVWAVGVNCCSDATGFVCPDYNNRNAAGGLRLLDDKERAYYRLAVQQAEATYDIQSSHPVFFHWMQDPFTEVNDHASKSMVNYGILCAMFGIMQLCIVMAALFYFMRASDEQQ